MATNKKPRKSKSSNNNNRKAGQAPVSAASKNFTQSPDRRYANIIGPELQDIRSERRLRLGVYAEVFNFGGSALYHDDKDLIRGKFMSLDNSLQNYRATMAMAFPTEERKQIKEYLEDMAAGAYMAAETFMDTLPENRQEFLELLKMWRQGLVHVDMEEKYKLMRDLTAMNSVDPVEVTHRQYFGQAIPSAIRGKQEWNVMIGGLGIREYLEPTRTREDIERFMVATIDRLLDMDPSDEAPQPEDITLPALQALPEPEPTPEPVLPQLPLDEAGLLEPKPKAKRAPRKKPSVVEQTTEVVAEPKKRASRAKKAA